ncbi:MAG: hypothetical protein ACR2L3_03645 [Actinomycetota bacterium]
MEQAGLRRATVRGTLATVMTLTLLSCQSEGRKPDAPLPPKEASSFLILAENELIKRCMERAGFQFITVPPEQLVPSAPGSQWGRDDVGFAKHRGYELAASKSGDVVVDPNAAYVASLSREEARQFTIAYSGTDKDRLSISLDNGTVFSINGEGCLADARRRLYGDLPAYFELSVATMQIEPEVDRRVAADPAYVDALRQWQECIHNEGYGFATPADAFAAASALYEESPIPSDAKVMETRIAVADAQCGVESRLARVGQSLESRYQKEIRAANEGEVIAALQLQAEAVERAKGILRAG